jgi:protein ImuA
MRNGVPDGESVVEFPSGAEAGGVERRSLIEHLRARIHVLERVPVSLALPPATDAGALSPACSLPSHPLSDVEISLSGAAISSPSPRKGEGGTARSAVPSGGHFSTTKPDPLPDPPPYWGRELPLSQLTQAGLHEIKPASYRDMPAALSFALAMLGQSLAKPAHRPELLLWCLTAHAAREWGRPYGAGLLALGLDPALLLIVEARTSNDAAWALEEGLKSGAATACLGQIEIEAPLFARRLGLAAKATRTPCLLLSGHRSNGLPGTLTRWRVGAEKSHAAAFDQNAPGDPCWHLTLERCRGMTMRSWSVELSDEQDRFRLSAAASDRAAEAGEREDRAYAH